MKLQSALLAGLSEVFVAGELSLDFLSDFSDFDLSLVVASVSDFSFLPLFE
jgi:hypothetical protein